MNTVRDEKRVSSSQHLAKSRVPEITAWGRAGFFDKTHGLFNQYTLGFAVELPDHTIFSHSLLKMRDQLPKGWRAIRYEEEGKLLFVVVETANGDRKRVLLRDENGYKH